MEISHKRGFSQPAVAHEHPGRLCHPKFVYILVTIFGGGLAGLLVYFVYFGSDFYFSHIPFMAPLFDHDQPFFAPFLYSSTRIPRGLKTMPVVVLC